MGEDIHFRVLVKSKKTGGYINAHDICEWNPEHSTFQELVIGRNYDLFSLFGSRRGNYKELQYANYGMPDFLRESVFDQYCEKLGLYGFIWWKLPYLKKAVAEYIESLKDPLKYLDEDSDEWQDLSDLASQGVKSSEQLASLAKSYASWTYDNKHMIDMLEEISSKLDMYDSLKGQNGHFGLDDIIDVDETVFLFFFDN